MIDLNNLPNYTAKVNEFIKRKRNITCKRFVVYEKIEPYGDMVHIDDVIVAMQFRNDFYNDMLKAYPHYIISMSDETVLTPSDFNTCRGN